MSDTIVVVEPITTIVESQPPSTIIVSPEQGPPGITGPGVADKITFSYGDASPSGIIIVPAGFVAYTVEIVLINGFDGDGLSTITVGDSGNNSRLFQTDQIDLSSPGTYISTPNHKYLDNTQVNLYISLGIGVTQGNGLIFLYKTQG